MDTTLVPSDYNTMVGLGGYNFTFVTQLAIDEIDWNNAFLPFNNTGYKDAVSNILQTDKVNFVNTYLGIGAAPAYSPIPGCITANSGYPWYDANTANIYTGGYAAALSELLSSGILLAADQITGGGTTYATWNFSAPFPVSKGASYNPLSPSGTSATGYNVMGDGADNNLGAGTGGLFILTRTSDQRQYIGPEVKQMLGPNFAAWYNSLAPTDPSVTLWRHALTAAHLPLTLVPYIDVTVEQITMAQIYNPVFSYYCFEMYTAGYSYSMLPSSMLENYLDSNAPQSFGWGPYHDPTCYSNPAYDGWEALMENSTTIGNALTPGTGLYYCYLAQMELMGSATYGAALDPQWVWTGYSPTLATDYQCIPYGYVGGYESWWTMLNGMPTAGSPGYSTNSFYAGMRSPTQNELNPVSTSAFYDSQVWGEIYDALAVSNPYNLSQLCPYIATNWSTGTWANPGNGKTDSMYTVTMRNDVEWQDVPGPENRASFTWNNGTELNGPLTDRFMTPLDVAFSYCYGALGWGFTIAYTYSGTISLDHVAISPIYEAAWEGTLGHNSTVDGATWCNETYVGSVMEIDPMTTLAWPIHQATTLGETPYYTTDQYLTNFVRFDPTLGPNQIEIYLSENWPWLGVYTALGMTILPFDIFSNLALGPWAITAPGFNHGNTWMTPDETVMDLEPHSYNSGTGADLLYGSGPFVLVDDAAAVPATTFRLDAYRAGLTYGPGLTTGGQPTITTDHGYFWSSSVRESDQMAFTMEPQGVSVPGQSPAVNLYYKAGTNTVCMQYSLTNYDEANGYTITFQPTLMPWWYVSGTWVEGTATGGSATMVALAAGASVMTPWFSFVLTVPSGATWLLPEESFNITITSSPTGIVGRTSQGKGFLRNEFAGYTSGIAMVNLAALAGDIGGGALTSPYYGANGVINLSDLSIITNNWQAHVNWATVNPTSAAARADINGDGICNFTDLDFITGNWMKRWSPAITTQPPSPP
jgi:hypothetical protein